MFYTRDTLPSLASNGTIPGTTTLVPAEEANVLFPGATLTNGKISAVPPNIMRPPPDPTITSWEGIKSQLATNFGIDPQELDRYHDEIEDKDSLLSIYKAMQLSRQFELACNKQYMVGARTTFIHA